MFDRGHPALMPEHSEPGYVSAITAGADFIECDVHFTRCNQDPMNCQQIVTKIIANEVRYLLTDNLICLLSKNYLLMFEIRDLVAVCSHDPWLDHLTDVGFI